MKKYPYTTILSMVVLLFLSTPILAQIQTYTSTGANTFTVPHGVTSITVEAWGGGGRGGALTGTDATAAGGGGGGYARSVLAVTAGQSYSLTVGAGSTSTVAGGTSSFNTNTAIAIGGGSVANNSNVSGAGGSGNTGNIVSYNGGFGAIGAVGSYGGGGGSSAGTASAGNFTSAGPAQRAGANAPTGGGNGGTGAVHNTPGTIGTSLGAGGGGGIRFSGVSTAPGNGANGQVTITWSCVGINVSNLTLPALSSSCLASPVRVTVNSTTLGDGPHIVYYSVSGSNVITNTSAILTFSDATNTGTFNTAALNNAGSSTIRINSIGCASIITGNTVNVTVNPAVVFTAAPLSPCRNREVMYSVTNFSGYTYSWSLPAGWATVGGTTGNSITVIPSATSGTIAVTPSTPSGPCNTITTSPITVATTSNTISSVNSVSRNGAGTVTLGATATGGTINWFTVATGGTSVNSGTSYLTPTISSNTTYYVETNDGCPSARVPVIATVLSQEIALVGNSNIIVINDMAPSYLDNTNFGETTAGVPIVKTFQIQNSGTLPLVISSVAVVGGAGFTFTPLATTIPAGAFGTFTVTFLSNTLGTQTATITVTNDDSDEGLYNFAIQATVATAAATAEIVVEANNTLIPDNTLLADTNVVNFTDYGNNFTTVGSTKTFTIKNIGALPLTISSSTSSNTTDFNIPSISTTIAPGASYNFTITFNALTAGAKTTTITIVNSDSDESSYDFVIKGNGVVLGLAQDILVSGNNINIPNQSAITFISNYTNLGNAFVGTPVTKTYVVRNTGGTDLTVSSWLIGGTNASEFAISAINSPIASGNQTTFTITFTPVVTGNRYANVTINSNASGNTRYSFAIEGLGITTVVNPLIQVEGNLIKINNTDNTPSIPDDTDFGSIQINNEKFKTYCIQNIGTNPLNLTGTPRVSISGPGSADFVVTMQPASPLASLDKTTFTIRFKPVDINVPTSRVATVSIANNDPTANPFTFDIKGNSIQTFYDSDNDGVFDNIDVDDDNDGIRDITEEGNCNISLANDKVNYKFLYETFGSGNRTTINTTYPAKTNYIYQDATNPTAGDNGNVTTSLIDGKYTVGSSAQIAEFAPRFWYKGNDHTGDVDGRMAIFNASFYPGVFYEAEVSGALPNVPISYSFWVLNLDRTDASNIGTRKRPNIRVEFRDSSGNLLQAIITGPVLPTTAGNIAGDWVNFTSSLTFAVGAFKVLFINNESGGAGNDLAIDDILITQSLCDRDSDGIADVFDLDADNDGIPDVVEAGLGNTTNGKAKINIAWLDANANGLHDSAESISALPALDSDGDGVPNYIDLDSDNDSLFDVDESGAGNTSSGVPNEFTNGDGDISGDGRGDGPESEEFRSKDSDGNGVNELYGDGILDIYDYGIGATFNDKYGNLNQGISSGNAATTYLKDTDLDGTPDYLDVMSNGTTHDIANNIKIYDYKILDTNNNGIIDGILDLDKDGIIDTFDTNSAYFGSPRDLGTKLFLDFDGRNDYAQSTAVLGGLSQVTLMSWINLNSLFDSSSTIVGQDKFQLVVNSSQNIAVTFNGTTHTLGSIALAKSQWYHVATTYDGSAIKLYLNGDLKQSFAVTGAIGADASLLTIGKNPVTNDNYFRGKIDEVRVFNTALTASQLQRMVYQEIKDNSGQIRGEIVPKNIATSPASLPFSNLLRYYRMDTYKDDIIDDLTTPATDVTGTKIYNHKNIYLQEAPMPFVTLRAGDFETAVDDTVKEIDGADITNDYSIVQVKHNITETIPTTDLGLFVDNGVKITINGDQKIQNDWYLKLDGSIDLEGRSQLLQTVESDLAPTSEGYIEKDQQGQSCTYNYNYWSSPVSTINNGTNNTNYTVNGIMKDGINSIPRNINWITGFDGVPGNSTTPVSLAKYWLYKFESNTDQYANWIQFSESSPLRVGQGYTLKGSGAATNFTFVGKPNNGLINSNSVAANDLLLVGNPYPSALNADQFINDNIINKGNGDGSTTDGTLYFWQHAPDNYSHNLAEYLGGYGVYNLTGGLPPVAPALISGLGSSTKIPNQYIPVGQSFFVYGNATGGPVVFNNGQRAFKKETESGSNTLFRTNTNAKNKENISNDEPLAPRYKKLRLGFNSSNNYHRQVLLGFMEDKATNAIDAGYDATSLDEFSTDMYFVHGETQLVIQGEGYFDESISYPLGVTTDKDCAVSFLIDAKENFSPNQNIYIYDTVTKEYHNIVTNKFETTISAGTNNTRFYLCFMIKKDAQANLNIAENSPQNSNVIVAVAKDRKIMTINNQMDDAIEQVTLINMTGQVIASSKIENQDQKNIQIQVHNMSSGIYVAKLKIKNGEISKKIIIN